MKYTIDYVLTRGVSEILPGKAGLARLMSKKKITLYQGFDPSMASLHLGNLVGLIKLSQFQKLGHKVIFLVGDFTGMIGDPTDKSATRKKLTRKEVLENAKSWKKQASMILNFSGQNPAKILYNSQWSDKLTFADLLETTSHFSVQRMLERDMFQKRIKEGKSISLHEFLYPVAQAYDSLFMNVDLEIGGSDQIFNMLAGRQLMRSAADKEKYVLATKLLVDKDGKKVGKTTGNALFLDKKPNEFYSGIMSFPDNVLEIAYELLTDEELSSTKTGISSNPMEAKKYLAYLIVSRLWGETSADKAKEYFENTFQKRQIPDSAKEVKIPKGKYALLDLIWETRQIQSRSQIKRLISAGAVSIDGEKINDPQKECDAKNGSIIKLGKITFIKLKIT